jgi:hypothetical protein
MRKIIVISASGKTKDTPARYPLLPARLRTVRDKVHPHGGMMSHKHGGRHRLETPGLVHCIRHHQVAKALEEYRRTWFTALLVPAKHSLAGLQRKAQIAAAAHAWIPATT